MLYLSGTYKKMVKELRQKSFKIGFIPFFKFSKTFGVVFFLIVASALTFLLVKNQQDIRQRAADEPTVSIYLSPTVGSIAPNDTLTLQVRINTNGQSVNAAQTNILYPSSLLSVDSVDNTGNNFGVVVPLTSSPGNLALAYGSFTPQVGDLLVTTINFKAIAQGDANVNFSNPLVISSVTNSNILETSINGSYDISSITQPPAEDITNPSVKLTSPKNGAGLRKGSRVKVGAKASDNVAIEKVEFYANNSLICSDTSAQYSCNWNVPNISNTTYTISATAYDTSGNTATSQVSVSVR